MNYAQEIQKFMSDNNINIASFVRKLKEDNSEDIFAKKLTQQKLYLSFQNKRPLKLEEFILIIIQLKKQFPEISADQFLNISNLFN